jgi:hypothetical protein
MRQTRYHSFLRISLAVSVFLLLFDGGFITPITAQLSDTTIAYLGSVGSSVFASVPANEINSLSAQISERQRELDARESALREREIAGRSFDTQGTTDYSTYILSVIVFILSVLMVLNFCMDGIRLRKMGLYEKQMG